MAHSHSEKSKIVFFLTRQEEERSMVKAEKDEVNIDSLDLEKEEDGNTSVGTFTGDIPIIHAEELARFSGFSQMFSGCSQVFTDILHKTFSR